MLHFVDKPISHAEYIHCHSISCLSLEVAVFTDFRLILTLLSNQERARFWVLVCLTFFVSVVEALTVVSILPFLEVISDPEAINEKDFLSFLFSFFDFDKRYIPAKMTKIERERATTTNMMIDFKFDQT